METISFNMMLIGIALIAVITIVAVNVLAPFAIKLSELAYGGPSSASVATKSAEDESHERGAKIVMALIGLSMLGWLLFTLIGMSATQK